MIVISPFLQEMPLLPTATLKQDHLNADCNKSAKSSTSSNSNSHRNRNKHTESSYSSSTLTAPCLPALLSTSGVESIVEEIADESQEVTQVITLSPEQYAALTGLYYSVGASCLNPGIRLA